MRQRSLAAVFLVLAACAGNRAGRPATIPQPELGAGVVNTIFFGSSNTAPATVEVRVKNRADVPITVTRIEVESSEMLEWGLLSQQRQYREVVEPNAVKALNFFATAVTNVNRRTEPLVFNIRVEFEAGGQRWIEFRRVTSRDVPF